MNMILASSSYAAQTSLFDQLVRAAEESALVTLPYHLRNFLVVCLSAHVHDTEIVCETIALSYLKAGEMRGEHAATLLRRAGEGALLLAGLFPERARRLNVSADYFCVVGQTAYLTLATETQVVRDPDRRAFYGFVAEQFAELIRVLRQARARPEREWEAFVRRTAPP